MVKLQGQVADVFAHSPYVAHVGSWSAAAADTNALNQGRLFVELKDKDQRPDLEKILSDLRRQLADVPGINAYMQPVQNLRLGARSSASASTSSSCRVSTPARRTSGHRKLTDAMVADHSAFTDVTTDLQNNALQATLVVDRDKAATLGIDADTLRLDALWRFRHRAGLDHLRFGRQLSGDHSSSIRRSRGRPKGCWPSRCGQPAAAWCRSAPSPASIAPPAR